MNTLVRRQKIIYTAKKTGGSPKRIARNPNEVTSQNNNAVRKEPPKNSITFFENPFTESVNPVYIRHLILSSPNRQAITIPCFLNSRAMAISSILCVFH